MKQKEHQNTPSGYKRISYHCIYDVKYDSRQKCRLVAGDHMTDPPNEDIFSGVVSMETVRICFTLAKLNGLDVCAGDIGNAVWQDQGEGKCHSRTRVW